MLDDPRERASVLRDLESDDDEVRRLAVERSAALAADEIVPRLVECLGDASWRVRKAAVARLTVVRERDAVAQALIAALGDGENPGRRNGAVDALIQCGQTVVERLAEATGASDPDVRKFAVDALAGIGDPTAVPALIAGLEDDDTNVRAAAADALGAVGGEAAARALGEIAVQSDQDPLVRFSALRALASLGIGVSVDRLADALEDPVLRPAALDVLLECEPDGAAMEVLIKALESSTRATREAAMRSLLRGLSHADGPAAEAVVARIRDAAERSPLLVTDAIERLTEGELATRLLLVQFLGLLRVPEAAVPVLLVGADEALQPVALASLESMAEVAEQAIDAVWNDLGADARRDACCFFGRSSGTRSTERLISALEDGEPSVRIEAVRSLAARGAVGAVAPLVRGLRRSPRDEFEGEEERRAVVEALIAIGAGADGDVAARTKALLLDALEGAREPVRVAVAGVLGRIGDREDAGVVSLLLKDASAKVRRAAVTALVRLDPAASVEPLHLAIADESTDVRIAAAVALGESERPEVGHDLCRLAADAAPRVRAAAIRALGLRPLPSGAPELRAEVERLLEEACGDEVPVALAAIEVAFATGGSLERMEALLHRPEPDVVREAVRCLGAHAPPAQLEAVIPLCAHPDWSVRAAAIQVLGEQGVKRAVPAILRRLDLEQDPFVRTVTLDALQRLEG